MKTRVCLIILLLSGFTLDMKAQQFSLQWALKLGQGGWDYVNSIISAPSGNLMVGGSLRGTLNQGKSYGEISDNNHAFLAACDVNGRLLWQKTSGGKQFSNITSLVSIPQGIMISGIFQDTIRFDSLRASTLAYTGAYLALADEKGKVSWLKQTGGPATISDVLLCSDSRGEVFMAGTFSDTLLMAGRAEALSGEKGLFLSGIGPDGNETTPVILKCSSNLTLGGISASDSLVCLAGSFSDTLVVKDTILISTGVEDVFIAVFTHEGNLKQLISAGGAGMDHVSSVAFSPAGEICFTGTFEYAFLLKGQLLKSNGGKDIFIAVINPSGQLQWIRNTGGTGDDYGYIITTDDKGDILVSGNFVHRIQMADEIGNIHEMEANSPFGNAFIAKYDIKGKLKALFNLPALGEDFCKSLIADKGMVMAAGNFHQSMQFPGKGSDELFSEGESDIFMLRFTDNCWDVSVEAGADSALCPDRSIYLSVPEAFPYFCWSGGIPNRNLEVNQPGTYKLLIKDAHGCITSDSLKITKQQLPYVHAGNDTVIDAGGMLRLIDASAARATGLRWTTTGSGYFSDPDILTTSYSPSYADIRKGSVQLVLSADNICGSVESSLKLTLRQDEEEITAFPNPAHNLVTFICSQGIHIRSLKVTRQNGTVVAINSAAIRSVMQFKLSAFPPGIYLFHFDTGKKIITKVISKL